MAPVNAVDEPQLFLDQLELGVTGTIVLMFCRMWDVYAATGRYLSTDFVVCDSKGSTMHATARNSIAHNFIKLKEGGICSVKNFAVQPNKDEFRVLKNATIMLEFDGSTTIRKVFVKPDGFIRFPFEMVDFEDLKTANNKYLIGMGSISAGYPVGSLGELLIKKRTNHVGCRQYMSSTSSTLILDDDNIPEIKQLKSGQTTQVCGAKFSKELLPVGCSDAKARTLENLLMWSRNRPRMARIFHLAEAKNAGNVLPVQMAALYRLELKVSDATAEVVVVMFNKTASSLVKCTADSIVEYEEQGEAAESDDETSFVAHTHMLHQGWVGVFRIKENPKELRLLSERTNARQYNKPTVAEVAALISNDFGDGIPSRDIIRNDQGNTLVRGGRLFQQYLVDAYSAVKEQRLKWTCNHQDTLRVDLYHNVCDAVTRGDTNAAGLGQIIVLPETFIGGPRYMMQNYQDAMALCRTYGNPYLFITFTSNLKWLEITEMLAYIPRQKAHDRPEIGTRIFKMKLTHLLHDLTKNQIFWATEAIVYVIEFQKRGLPHAHILLWLEENNKCKTPAQIDDIISSELPLPMEDPDGYLAPCEAVWRLFSFNIYYSFPSVMKLNFNLPNQNPVTLRDSEFLPALLEREGERYFMRMLLNVVRGPKDFDELMTVNNRLCQTFKEACFAYGLLNDDKEWTKVIEEASLRALGSQLHDLFVTILLFYDVNRLLKLWKETWEYLSEDILHIKRKLYAYVEFQLSIDQIQNYCLVEIQELLNRNGRSLTDFQDLLQAPKKEKIFGGITVLLGGDFRQILLVMPKGKRPDVVQACINRSELWKHCNVFTLTRSMRVNEYYPNGEIDNQKQDFNQWVLCVGNDASPIEAILAETYPNFIERQHDEEYLKELTILTPRNDDVDEINTYVFKKLTGKSVTYNSADEVCKASTECLDQQQLYPTEFLNTLNFSGMPPHALCLMPYKGIANNASKEC
uniref:ATP-dependent DNA helicase n=1 Tax=Tanacetum cinerariifolium TaxID=118510 RepID=A0A6L2MXG9_TANCI|nr:hypothetical protein CTI12_AA123990 [Tanacetum cinerariifolium]